MEDFNQLLQTYTYTPPQIGEIVTGEILSIRNEFVLLDIGANRDAIVAPQEVKGFDRAFWETLSVGAQIPVFVLETTTSSDKLQVSILRGLEQKEWTDALDLMARDETCTAEYIGYNKGGLIVKFGHLTGFVPISHIPSLLNIADLHVLQAQKAKLVGTTSQFKLIEVNREADRLLLSERKAQEVLSQARLEALSEGDIVTGMITGIKKYGVFLELGGGIRGLIHVSELSWEFVSHPDDLELQRGDRLEARIESVDLENRRVSLSRKKLLPSPWQQFTEMYKENDLIEGVVSSVAPFGLFVRLISGVEGLIHSSEVVKEVELEVDSAVLVRIISLDEAQEQVGLSMKQVAAEEPTAEIEAQTTTAV